MKELSLRKYAKHRGVSLKAVQNAIAAQRIKPQANGKIDPDEADKQWAANTNVAKRHHEPKTAPSSLFEEQPPAATTEPPARATFGIQDWPEGFPTSTPLPTAKPLLEEPVAAAVTMPSAPSALDSFMEWKTLQMRYDAERSRLKYEEAVKTVLPTAGVKTQFFDLARIVAAAHEQLPGLLALELMGKSDLAEIEGILRNAIRKLDERIADECENRVAHYLDLARNDNGARSAVA